MKRNFKKIALVASFAAFGCNCGIVNTVGLLEGTMSDLLKLSAAVTIAKFASDNLDLTEKGKIKLMRILKKFPKDLEDKCVSEELAKNINEFINFYNKNTKDGEKIGNIEGEGLGKLSFKKAYELADKMNNKQLDKKLDSEAIAHLKKDRFINLSISRESSLAIQGEENQEKKEEKKEENKEENKGNEKG